MTYHYFCEKGAASKPVILALHGTGGDENQFVGLIRWIFPDAGILAPRGDVSESGANRFFRRTGEGVYDMKDLDLRTGRMLDFVAQARRAFPGRPFFAFGYSNGANILAAMLFRQPKLLDRAALLHPLIPWTPLPQPDLQGRPVFISVGRNDPICPLSQSNALIKWFNRQGAAVESLIERGGHDIRQEEIIALRCFLADEPSIAWSNSGKTARTFDGIALTIDRFRDNAMNDKPVITIDYEDSGEKCRYIARIEGIAEEGELTIAKVSDVLIVADHTFVPDMMRGSGVAAALVKRLIADARDRGQRVVPLCSYVRAQSQRHPEWADVIQN